MIHRTPYLCFLPLSLHFCLLRSDKVRTFDVSRDEIQGLYEGGTGFDPAAAAAGAAAVVGAAAVFFFFGFFGFSAEPGTA